MTRRLPSLAALSVLLLALHSQAVALSIAAFGDSITRGWPYYTDNANGIANNGGYIPWLQSQLNATDWGAGDDVTVYNWGHPGEYIFYEGRYRIAEVLASNPDYVLIMEGTNDLALGIGPGAIYDKLTAVVNDVINDGAIPALGTLLPRYDEYAYENSDIATLNSNLRNYAEQQDIALADLQTANPSGHSWSEFLPDGLHPNTTGYGFMADEWFIALQTVPPNEEPVAHAGADQTFYGFRGTGVGTTTLNGNGSYDPDGYIQSWAWSWDGGAAWGATPEVDLPIGTNVVTLTVTDNGGASDSDTVTITVEASPVLTPMLHMLLLSD